MQAQSVEITPDNAQQWLIDESFNRPVLIDFWADWCGPCKSLAPILEKLSAEYGGGFLLAKVNADDQHMIAAQFRVQSLPTVIIMKDGQPVDGFAGAQPETEIRKLLDKHLPKPWDKLLAQGRELLDQGQASEALTPLREAYTLSEKRGDIACALAMAYVHTRRFAEAEEVIAGVKMVDQGPEYEQVKAQLELAENAEKAPEVSELEKQLEAKPGDQEIAFQLAVQYSQHGYQKEALVLLFEILTGDIGARDGEVRRVFTDVISVLGKGDPLAAEYQRKLFSLLY